MISHEEGADAHLARRIDKMHSGDRTGLIAFILVLWCTLLFVLFTVWPYVSVPAIRVILTISAGLVLLFNTAAVVAMLRHYHNDKHFIYGLDIKHLDQMRQRRR